jgi:hypothetical protein
MRLHNIAEINHFTHPEKCFRTATSDKTLALGHLTADTTNVGLQQTKTFIYAVSNTFSAAESSLARSIYSDKKHVIK